MWTMKTLIRLGGSQGLSVSSLDAKPKLLLVSRSASFDTKHVPLSVVFPILSTLCPWLQHAQDASSVAFLQPESIDMI